MKHLFFDLDKTLWDLEKNSKAALEILYTDLNLSDYTRSFNSFHKTYKKINAELWYRYGQGKITREELRFKRFMETLKRFQITDVALANTLNEVYSSISPYQTNLFPEAINTLEALKKDNHTLHIITNGFKDVQYIKLEKSGLRDYFDVIVCSDEIGKNKPALDVFQYAMTNAKADPTESIMIGDDYRVDVVGAIRAGMQGILFDPEYSYRDGTHEWHINALKQIPETIPWIRKTMI
ncbi:MAG: YjjG family noncanonical pyrimidine nucleotidase [Crocinitomicaceae bacterium]|nr:YjjG family noncanonical pyrimidine nucleotidase [Crocinitomicaceae bacterium]